MRVISAALLFISLITNGCLAFADCNEPYPPSLVKGFRHDCVRNAKLEAFCGCVIDTIQKTITLSDFIETGSKPDGLNNDPRVIRATTECSSKYPPNPASSK